MSMGIHKRTRFRKFGVIQFFAKGELAHLRIKIIEGVFGHAGGNG